MAHNFRTPIAEMNDHQKEWFAMSIVTMVLADGNVTSEEAQSLVQSLSFIKNQTLVESLKKYISYQTAPVMTAFTGWEKKPKNRAFIMLDLMHVAIADRDFSPGEKEKFLHIGNLLGFSRPKVEELIALGDKALENLPDGE